MACWFIFETLAPRSVFSPQYYGVSVPPPVGTWTSSTQLGTFPSDNERRFRCQSLTGTGGGIPNSECSCQIAHLGHSLSIYFLPSSQRGVIAFITRGVVKTRGESQRACLWSIPFVQRPTSYPFLVTMCAVACAWVVLASALPLMGPAPRFSDMLHSPPHYWVCKALRWQAFYSRG